jgi:phospholipase/carboxylesterase
MIVQEIAGTRCRIVEEKTTGNDRHQPPLLVVLCHGFGAPGDDLVPLASELRRHDASLDAVRFVFPEAPIDLAESGVMPGMWGGSRAWWMIEVGRVMTLLQSGRAEEACAEIPDGLPSARRKMMALVNALQISTKLPMSRIVLGGFSQGAMLATDTTLRLEEAPAALAIFSGTLIASEEWRRFAPNRKGLRVYQAHGRQDPLLPFVAAEWARDLLVECGLNVDFLGFEGEHTIVPEQLRGFACLLADLLDK